MYPNVTERSEEPIYEQIESQIRGAILSGKLSANEGLPSIRAMARELKIGVITAKRAYDDLIAEGFLYALPGKGIFVAARREGDLQKYKTERLCALLREAKAYAEQNGIEKEEAESLFHRIMED